MSTVAQDSGWSYAEAFSRNRGLIAESEQARLRQACVAIAGVGGVGGGHALTLARQGVGRFRLADPDRFSVANFNRQAGATLSSLGVNKAAEVRRLILEINPEAEVTLFEEGVTEQNVDRFLEGVGVVLDGLDFFAIEARRTLYAAARVKGLWTLTAGPIGWSAASLSFDPRGMSFETYFGLTPKLSREEQIIAFAVALTPATTHLRYTDLSQVQIDKGIGPSAGLACVLCNAVISMDALAILLGRRPPRAAPRYAQLDLYRRIWKTGRLWFGNRGPLQLLKRALFRRHLVRLGVIANAAKNHGSDEASRR